MTYLPLAARVFLALVFLNAGINHLSNFQNFAQGIADKGLPLATVLAAGTVVFQILGAIALIIGFKSKLGALLLIVFLVPATLLYHPPTTDLTQFLKNLGLIGGLMMVMAYGPGLISVDGRDA